MLTAMRCGDIARSTYEELKASKEGEMRESLPSGSYAMALGGGPGVTIDSDPDDCGSLAAVAQLTRSVVSLSLFDRGVNVFSCAGIPVECKLSYIKILTSSNLARTLFDKSKSGSTIVIYVRDTSNNVAIGWLEQQYFDLGIAYVNVTEFLDVCAVNLHPGVEFQPTSNLVAIRFTGTGTAPVSGVLTKDSNSCEDSEVLYKISKADDGGPLFDDDGNFIGMNFFSDSGRYKLVRRDVIVEQLKNIETRNKVLKSRRLNAFKFRPSYEPEPEKRRRGLSILRSRSQSMPTLVSSSEGRSND